MTGPLLVKQDGDVRWLRLNRPDRRNALNADLVAALDNAVHEAINDLQTTVIVIAGEGRSFCAGADLIHLHSLAEQGRDPLPFLSQIADCFDRLEAASKPVVAVIHGHAVAGGMELALACDVVIAEAGALVGDGHVRHGLLPAGGSSVRLPRKVGEPLARWLILTGQLLPAEAFVPSGFVHAVADPLALDSTVDQVIDALRDSTGAAQRNGKALLGRQTLSDRHDAQQAEHDAFVANWANPALLAGLSSFVNRATSNDYPAT